MSSSINDQVRRTVLNNCFVEVRKGSDADLRKWDALLDCFSAHSPEVAAPALTSGDAGPKAGGEEASSGPPAPTTVNQLRMQRLGLKLSQMASKMYGLSINAVNNQELFLMCVILGLKNFEVPAAATEDPASTPATEIQELPAADQLSQSMFIDEVEDKGATPEGAPSPAANVVKPLKLPSKRVLQTELEDYHYRKNPPPERVRRPPEVLVYDPPTTISKKVVKKVAAPAAPAPLSAPSAGAKRERGTTAAVAKEPVAKKGARASKVEIPTQTATRSGLPKTNTTSGNAPAVPRRSDMSLIMADLASSRYSSSSGSDDGIENDGNHNVGAEEVEVAVDRQEVFNYKPAAGISALAEDDREAEVDEDDTSPEGVWRRKQLQLVQVLRLEGLLTKDIALKVLNNKKTGGGGPPATVEDVAAHFRDIVLRGHAILEYDCLFQTS